MRRVVVASTIGLAVSASGALASNPASTPSTAETAPPVYRVSEHVAGHSYTYWDEKWAKFEWEAGGKASPLLHPQGCKHLTIGNVFLLPGPGNTAKPQTITCSVPAGKNLFLPTASELYVRTGAKGDPPVAKLVQVVTAGYPKGIKTLDVSLDGKPINARAYATVTPVFRLNAKKGSPIGQAGSFPTVQGGYNLLLRPLPAGSHTIKLHIVIVQGKKVVFESRPTYRVNVATP